MSEPLEFGKYKGWDIDDVIEDDPEYIIWCYENDVKPEVIDEDLYEIAIKKSIERGRK